MGRTVTGELPVAMAAIPLALLERAEVAVQRLVEVVRKFLVDLRVQPAPIQVLLAPVGLFVVILVAAVGEAGTVVEQAMMQEVEADPVITQDWWLGMALGVKLETDTW